MIYCCNMHILTLLTKYNTSLTGLMLGIIMTDQWGLEDTAVGLIRSWPLTTAAFIRAIDTRYPRSL